MSSKGKKYVMVFYYPDTIAILAESLKSRSQQKIIDAQIKLHDYLADSGFTLRVKILDSQCSEALKHHF